MVLENGITLDGMFENSTKIREYLSMQAKLNPAMINAIFDTIIDPTKVCVSLNQ